MFKNFQKIEKPFLIAEAGINHNGKFNHALKLVDLAKKSGADAIKFQTYKTEKRVKRNNSVYNILKKCELSFEDFFKIKKYCDKKKIVFFSTPFDIESVDFLEKTPFICLVSFDVFIFPNPTLIASYPLLSFVITSIILPFSTDNTVTGTEIPESKNSLVIPIFFPINPIVIKYPIILFLYLLLKLNLIS